MVLPVPAPPRGGARSLFRLARSSGRRRSPQAAGGAGRGGAEPTCTPLPSPRRTHKAAAALLRAFLPLSHPPRPALSAAPRPVPPPAAAPPSPRAASQGEEPAQADTERRAERGHGASSPALSALPPQPQRGTGSRSKGKCLLGTSNFKKKKQTTTYARNMLKCNR